MTSPMPTKSALCMPARAAEALPARVNAIAGESAAAGNGGNTMYTEDLFNLVKADCGGCHLSPVNLGNFTFTPKTFSTVVDQTVLAQIQSDDPTKAMPPQSKGFSQRAATDPIVILANLLSQWIAQGRPDELFTVSDPSGSDADSGGSDSNASPYLLSPDVGTHMTDIGSCVPGAAMVGTSTDTMDKIDQAFAAMTDLPDNLEDTDLTTLDTAQLAHNGVIAYVPQYPLWTDGAGKLRYVRVPKGQSITFDKTAQKFKIPPNTRFYKTFMRQVIDRDGNQTFRKIETRVIVARLDQTMADGTTQPTALYGTYLWNEDETKAVKTSLPLRNGEPFTDTLLSITVDEPREQMIRDSMPANLSYALDNAQPSLKRHYAVPGGQRCIQCHMGSVNEDFILGFLPLQIARRPSGTGGAYEDTGPDELDQLQRLIDYGVIGGMVPTDVLPLEQSEGSKTPRNDYELAAQAYMLGNCAHCHNPRGYPSIKNPDLKDTLDFMPSPSGGGVFQFPLTTVSPLRARGSQQEIPLPYLTPSLREYPVASYNYEPPGASSNIWTLKWVPHCSNSDDAFAQFVCDGRTDDGPGHLPAPWRSLLYRNVDTPFMYADDYVVFPHMPMNSPGFDCRTPRIMGSWMASIPAVRKNPEIDEDAVPGETKKINGNDTAVAVDTNPQPYVEVHPGDDGYNDAVAAANKRVTEYQTGGRYKFCPDQSDIVDPAVIKAGGALPIVPVADDVYDPTDPTKLLQPGVGVPVRAHWVITDTTDPPGDWNPRRVDWVNYIVMSQANTTNLPPVSSPDARADEVRARANAQAAVHGATITDQMRTFALTDLPYGVWQGKPNCDLSPFPKVSSFDNVSAPRPRWMNADPTNLPDPNGAVYMMSPGAAVFNNICINCHGPQADSKGLMADALMNMTGGTARVANFRDGFLGPADMPGANRMRVFGTPDLLTNGLSADDWAARYVSWMALGGTAVTIPDAILNIVSTTRILGVSRGQQSVPSTSANMLKLAQNLCAQVLPLIDQNTTIPFDADYAFPRGYIEWGANTALIGSNGDAEMWQQLCSLGNRQVVRVLQPKGGLWINSTGTAGGLEIRPTQSFYWGDAYPLDAPVLNQRGELKMGLTADNVFPVCVQKPSGAADLAAAEALLSAHPVGPGKVKMPYCPDQVITASSSQLVATEDQDNRYTFTDADAWATRGAVNAGVAVFLYLKKLEADPTAAKTPYNHCELLPKN
jgi:mono/diheme cytochrome c family protein